MSGVPVCIKGWVAALVIRQITAALRPIPDMGLLLRIARKRTSISASKTAETGG